MVTQTPFGPVEEPDPPAPVQVAEKRGFGPFPPGVRAPNAPPVWKPGQTGNPRKLGYDKITSRNIRAAVCEALSRVGGVEYLMRQARRCPKAFLALLGKVFPHEPLINVNNYAATLKIVRVTHEQVQAQRALTTPAPQPVIDVEPEPQETREPATATD